jgi:RNA polymerase sigma-70 factor (ECF subfamily)
MGSGELVTPGRRPERSAALTDAYLVHRQDLFRFARRRLHGDPMLAEETVQETFLRAWRSLDRFDPATGTMRMWLFAICRNAATDAARVQARNARDDIAAAGRSDAAAVEVAIDHVARRHIDDALRSLPPGQRRAIIEVHLRQRPYADVARDLGVPVGTVKSRVHLGLRSARAALVAA